MMMAGRLEANAEEELFKVKERERERGRGSMPFLTIIYLQDLPRPDFMSKDISEMTEDEIRMKHEFEKKEAAWLEEREKMKKVMSAHNK